MAEKLICPNCSKSCYTAAPEAYNPCPHCSWVFKKEGGLERKHPQIDT